SRRLAASAAPCGRAPGVCATNDVTTRRPQCQRGTAAASGRTTEPGGASADGAPPHCRARRRHESGKLTLRGRDQSSSPLASLPPPSRVTPAATWPLGAGGGAAHSIISRGPKHVPSCPLSGHARHNSACLLMTLAV